MDELTRDTRRSEVILRNPTPELLAELQRVAGDSWESCSPARNSLEKVFLDGIRARLEAEGRSVPKG